MNRMMKQTTVYTDETGAEVMHFEKWLSEEEIHDIAKEQFTHACRRFLNDEGYCGRKPTEGYQLLAKIVKELEPELKEKVKELSDGYLKDFSKKEMEYVMEDVIHEALFPNGEEEG